MWVLIEWYEDRPKIIETYLIEDKCKIALQYHSNKSSIYKYTIELIGKPI